MRLARLLPLVLLPLLAAPLPARGQEPAAALLRWMEGLLPALPRIAGQVVTGDGVPVAGALVRASRQPDREERITLDAEVETDRQGRFLLFPMAGTHSLEIHALGFLRAQLPGLSAFPGRPVAGLTIRLLPGAVLTGRVLDEAGAPVAGAKLRLLGGDSFTLEALSDDGGRYRLDGIDPGECEVWVSRDGDHAAVSRVQIARGENRLDLPFVRRPVRGRVLNPEGEPVAGAQVRLRGSGGEEVALTGDDGAFAFRMTEAWARLDVQTAGYVHYRSRLLRVGGAAAEAIEVRLTRGAMLRGRVGGLPAGETIRMSAVDEATQEFAPGSVVDPQGRYEIRDLAPGTWHVTASAAQKHTAGTAILKPGDREARLDLTFPAYWPVRGRVVDRDGAPVATVLVLLHSVGGSDPQGAAVSGLDGTFSLLLPDGTYVATVSLDEYARAVSAEPVAVEGAAVDGVEIRLTAGITLTGRVLGLTPEELAESSITAQRDNYASQTGWLDDREGSYAIEHLGPGDWTVTAYHDGESAVAPLRLAPGERQATLDLTFVRGDLTLRGGLHGGDPLADYVAELSPEGKPDDPRVLAPDRQGVFQFTRLRPGRYRLKIQDANLTSLGGGPAYDQVIELARDRDLEIELPAAPEGSP
ncbi:MAG TPA: carboxypeptidase-like regulatory domain-containing protein [Thermoanaerobaculia bacterium]|nr:carboxypeptidase-like regulatory domain-containing protein [Thermoanaerobaculia bacterium]